MAIRLRRWRALPVTLTTLALGACGAGTLPGGGADLMTVPSDPAVASSTRPALPSAECRGWAISLPSTDVRGADTPEDAANSTRFGVPPESAFSSTQWTRAASSMGGVTLTQDAGAVEVSQMPDGSWYVMSGQRCS